MTTAQWALTVACASAVFTGINVLVSSMTFRRVRPRVEASFRLFDSDDTELALLLNLRNKGQYPITVVKEVLVWLAPLDEPPKDRFNQIPKRDRILEAIHPYLVTVHIPNSELREVPAFGGIRYQCQLDTTSYTDRISHKNHIYAHMLVTLSNGVEVRTPWVRIHHPDAKISHGYLPRPN